MKIVLLLTYDGTEFSGWQKQKNFRTVQGVLEEAARSVFSQEVKITGSGRTDAGVHALGQVCEFEAETTIPPEKIRECFNRILPPDVKVRKSAEAPAGFDCTRAKKSKIYRYRAYFSECEMPLSERYELRISKKPDLAAMREAAALLVGEHDFAAFRAVGSSAKTTVRTLHSVTVWAREEIGATHYAIDVCGNGFLYNMVRIIAGELLAVGQGKSMEALLKALATGDRALLAGTLPAKGLSLLKTEYEPPLFGGTEE